MVRPIWVVMTEVTEDREWVTVLNQNTMLYTFWLTRADGSQAVHLHSKVQQGNIWQLYFSLASRHLCNDLTWYQNGSPSLFLRIQKLAISWAEHIFLKQRLCLQLSSKQPALYLRISQSQATCLDCLDLP